MELRVESHSNNPEVKRLVAVPSEKYGFFVDRSGGHKKVFTSIGLEGATEEQIEAAERGELSANDLFATTYFDRGADHYIAVSSGYPELAAVAVEGAVGDQSYPTIKVFQEAQLFLPQVTEKQIND